MLNNVGRREQLRFIAIFLFLASIFCSLLFYIFCPLSLPYYKIGTGEVTQTNSVSSKGLHIRQLQFRFVEPQRPGKSKKNLSKDPIQNKNQSLPLLIAGQSLIRFSVSPEYPSNCNDYGEVELEAVTNSEGLVDHVRIVKSSNHQILDQISIKALKSWQFNLTTPSRVRTTFVFKPSNQTSKVP
jgi:TonB family protein